MLKREGAAAPAVVRDTPIGSSCETIVAWPAQADAGKANRQTTAMRSVLGKSVLGQCAHAGRAKTRR